MELVVLVRTKTPSSQLEYKDAPSISTKDKINIKLDNKTRRYQ